MDSLQFKQFAKASIDYIADYMDNIRERPVLPSVEPGFLVDIMPDEAPEEGQPWQDIFKDVEQIVMPGMTHWCSPYFHAYFPSQSSFPAIVGEMMSAGLASLSTASPVYLELEKLVMNWLAKMFDLPEIFLNTNDGNGGGIFEVSTNEGTILCFEAAKFRKIEEMQKLHPEWDENYIKNKLVAYTSECSNIMIEKTRSIAGISIRLLQTDENGCLQFSTLADAVREDRQKGLIPCFVLCTIGTAGQCAFDDLKDIGPFCVSEGIWFHVDAAYSGAAFVCPEYRYLMEGIEFADSLNINPHKWFITNFDCSALWFKDKKYFQSTTIVTQTGIQHQFDDCNLQLNLTSRFRALKVWFLLRIYGVEGIQKYIRRQIELAKYMERLMRKDDKFEIVFPAVLGMFCFRMKGKNSRTKGLNERLLDSRKTFLTMVKLHGVFYMRFVICSILTTEKDLERDYKEISSQAKEVILDEIRKRIRKSEECEKLKDCGPISE